MSKITIPGNSILLLEGGSLRGLYTAGVLDTFMENDLYFPAVAGVSAGSLNAMNYVSRQPGRSASINLRYRHDPRYFGPKAARRQRVWPAIYAARRQKRSAVRRGDVPERWYADDCGGHECSDRKARLF